MTYAKTDGMNPDKILGFIDRRMRQRHLWLLLAAVIALDVLMLSYTARKLSVHGLPMFDLRCGGYGVSDARTYVEGLTAANKLWRYAFVQIPIDMAFAIIEAAALAALYLWFTRPKARFSIAMPGKARMLLLLFPAGQALFDLSENSLVWVMLKSGPSVSPSLVRAASFSTTTKWALAMMSVGIAAALAIAAWQTGKEKARG